MLNHKHISRIINTTLKQRGVYDPALEKLIKLTFFAESGLEDLFDDADPYNPKHGMMMMNDRRIDHLLREVIAFKPSSVTHIMSMFNQQSYDINYLKSQVDSDISLMVLLTFEFYSHAYVNAPENTLRDVGRYYLKYFNTDTDVVLDDLLFEYESAIYV